MDLETSENTTSASGSFPRGDDGRIDVDPDVAWRCVRAKTKTEHMAARALKTVEEVDVFCPRIRYQKATKRGKIWYVEALFPGYLFARFSKELKLRHVAATHGVSGLVRFGNQYAALPDGTINTLIGEFGLDPEKPKVIALKGFDVGDAVEVAEGPFRGSIARVTAVPTGGERVRILMEMLGQKREIEVPFTSLLGLPDPDELDLE